MKGLSIEWKTNGFGKKVDKALDLIDEAVVRALGIIGDELLERSVQQVPHDEGQLQATGNSKVDAKDTVVHVGYNKEYGAYLHEHPEFRFKKGRKGKYLEDPWKQGAKDWNNILAKELEKVL